MTEQSAAPVDFSVRPNKSVERKLIFEALSELGRTVNLKKYQYVGFGALWFIDLLLAYRTLGIRDLHSIELDPRIWARALRSRPLSCIQVHQGVASDVLLRPELRITERKSIVWLDYYGTASPETIADVDRLCRELPLGSVILLTLNAEPRTLSEKPADWPQKLRELFGDWVPESPEPDEYFGRALNQFPKRLAELVWGRAVNTARAAGRTLEALFNFAYKDSAAMITLGGILTDQRVAAHVAASGTRKRLGVLKTGKLDMTEGWPKLTEQTHVRVPVLTRLERLRLNRELPGRLGPRRVKELCGHELTADERDAYSKFFAHYPSYAEFDL